MINSELFRDLGVWFVSKLSVNEHMSLKMSEIRKFHTILLIDVVCHFIYFMLYCSF